MNSKKKQVKFSYEEIKDILNKNLKDKSEVNKILKAFSYYASKRIKLENEVLKEYYKLINEYFSVIKDEIKKNNIEIRYKTKAYRKYMPYIIFKFLSTEESSVKELIESENISNLKDLISFFVEMKRKNEVLEDKKIVNFLFIPFEKPFRIFIKNFINTRYSINRKVPVELRDDIILLLYKKFDLIKITLDKHNVETKNAWEDLIKSVSIFNLQNKWTGLFYYLLKNCKDLDSSEISVLMLLLNFMNQDGSAFLCQEEAGKLLKLTRQSISKKLKSLIEKRYITEDKDHPYSYKNKLCKIYKIHLDKLLFKQSE